MSQRVGFLGKTRSHQKKWMKCSRTAFLLRWIKTLYETFEIKITFFCAIFNHHGWTLCLIEFKFHWFQLNIEHWIHKHWIFDHHGWLNIQCWHASGPCQASFLSLSNTLNCSVTLQPWWCSSSSTSSSINVPLPSPPFPHPLLSASEGKNSSSVHPTLYPSNCPRRYITLSAEATLLWDAGHSRDGQEGLAVRWQHEEPSVTTVWPALTFQRRKSLLALHRKSKVRIPKDLSAVCFGRPRKIMRLCHRSDVQI